MSQKTPKPIFYGAIFFDGKVICLVYLEGDKLVGKRSTVWYMGDLNISQSNNGYYLNNGQIPIAKFSLDHGLIAIEAAMDEALTLELVGKSRFQELKKELFLSGHGLIGI